MLGLLAACEPSKEKQAQLAEEKRVECLDKFCEGDVVPRRDFAKDGLLKLNGQWYLGPKEYLAVVGMVAASTGQVDCRCLRLATASKA